MGAADNKRTNGSGRTAHNYKRSGDDAYRFISYVLVIMRNLVWPSIVLLSIVALVALYYGIPAGSVVEDATIIQEGVVTAFVPRRVKLKREARYYDLELSSGEIVRVSTNQEIVSGSQVVLNRRYSLISHRYIYSLAEQ